MRKNAVKYWDQIASVSPEDARDAVLAGFRSESDFDKAGQADVEHLVLPFINEKSHVLDIGCGLGRLTKWVAPHCGSITGLDVSRQMLSLAAKRLAGAGNVKFGRLPLSLEFPVKSGSIDFAYFYHVSEHMDREDAFQVLQEIRRCLRRDGAALVQFSVLDHDDNQYEFKKWARHGDEEGVRSRFYTESEANIMLRMARLYPQIRLYVPGEFAVVVVKSDERVLGSMPLVRLRTGQKNDAPEKRAGGRLSKKAVKGR